MERKDIYIESSASGTNNDNLAAMCEEQDTPQSIAELSIKAENNRKEMERYLKLHIANHRPG